MIRFANANPYPGRVGRFTAGQIAQRKSWAGVPDAQLTVAAMHTVHVVPHGASTCVYVNPLDPATVDDPGDSVAPSERAWMHRPGAAGTVYRHRPAWWMQ